MVLTGIELGHEWLVLTDHSPQLRVANGLTVERLTQQIGIVEAIDRSLGAVVQAAEGHRGRHPRRRGLDQTEAMLARLDLVTASVHSKLRMNGGPMTTRMVTAVSNPRVNVLGHCTGRLVRGRAARGRSRTSTPGRCSRRAPSTTPPSRSTAAPSGATRPTSSCCSPRDRLPVRHRLRRARPRPARHEGLRLRARRAARRARRTGSSRPGMPTASSPGRAPAADRWPRGAREARRPLIADRCRLRRCGGRVLRGRRAGRATSTPRACEQHADAVVVGPQHAERQVLVRGSPCVRARMASRRASSRTFLEPSPRSAGCRQARSVGGHRGLSARRSRRRRGGRCPDLPAAGGASRAPSPNWRVDGIADGSRSMPSERSAAASSSPSGRGRVRAWGTQGGAHGILGDAVVGEQVAGAAALLGQGEEEVDRAHLVGVEASCTGRWLRDDDGAGVAREAFEHGYLRACLRWTVCLVTPSASAMSCHDQPLARALRTCSASSWSSRRPSAATARRPTVGSVLSRSPARSVAVRGHGRQHMLTHGRASTYADEIAAGERTRPGAGIPVLVAAGCPLCFRSPRRIRALRAARP